MKRPSRSKNISSGMGTKSNASSKNFSSKINGDDEFSNVIGKNSSNGVKYTLTGGGEGVPFENDASTPSDALNYALLIGLYTIQGIPMGLSASIPFLIQQKVATMTNLASTAGSAGASEIVESIAELSQHNHHASITKMAYNAQAIFALCSWPFSLKLLWAPIVDAVFSNRFGRRKSWLIPVQTLAGAMMILGSEYVETQLGLSSSDLSESGDPTTIGTNFDVRGVTVFFFVLYFLMATQDIAVDGWALTMLSKKNRGRGPVCNSIGQNLGYFLAFVGFLAFNDPDSSENLWRPLLRLKSNPGTGMVSLGGFIRFMGILTLLLTTFIALFKTENSLTSQPQNQDDDDPGELDASEIGIKETYTRLLALCQLPAVKSLFLILLTFRFPTALSDNVKFLKAVEFGLSKQTTALLSPTIILPLGILVPIVASKIWHGHPLKQFLAAYKFRVLIVPIFDLFMIHMIRKVKGQLNGNVPFGVNAMFWVSVIGSTAFQTIAHSLQFNAIMTFFASRVDPAIGGSYMTLLNTAANLGGTWPASIIMLLVGKFTIPEKCEISPNGEEMCTGGSDPYFPLQITLSLLGILWLVLLGGKTEEVSNLGESAWRTNLSTEAQNMNSSDVLETGKTKEGKEKAK